MRFQSCPHPCSLTLISPILDPGSSLDTPDKNGLHFKNMKAEIFSKLSKRYVRNKFTHLNISKKRNS